MSTASRFHSVTVDTVCQLDGIQHCLGDKPLSTSVREFLARELHSAGTGVNWMKRRKGVRELSTGISPAGSCLWIQCNHQLRHTPAITASLGAGGGAYGDGDGDLHSQSVSHSKSF